MGIGIYDEAWFDYRLTLFERITFPSVSQQRNAEFTWLIAVDRNMPSAARSRFDRIVAESPRVLILELELKTDFVPAVSAWCTAHGADDGRLLTSRVDDDDALRLDAFEHLHAMADRALAHERTYGVFSFELGARWDPLHNLAYRAYHHSLGIGLSFLEPLSEARTVYSRPHLNIKSLVAPKGAYIESMGGADYFWLYTTHAMADTDKGDQRRVEKIRKHAWREELSAAELASFGLSPNIRNELEALGGRGKSEEAFRVSTQTNRIEGLIRKHRRLLADAPAAEKADLETIIEALQLQRVALGTGISAASS
jgi:hypothetical protein